jgi:hypothetical protein
LITTIKQLILHMRTAQICPTCATYENALCILYNGPYLSNIDVDPLDSMQSALKSVNDNLVPVVGIIAPTANAKYIGQLYVNTAAPALYFAKSVGLGAADWVSL